MRIDKQTALQHLDAVIAEFDALEAGLEKGRALSKAQRRADYSDTDIVATATRLRAALDRLSPPGSEYALMLKQRTFSQWDDCRRLAGFVKALRDDYAGDYLGTFRELLNADLYSDFLDMAEYLLQDESLKDPAAVLAGGVLEEHIRKLCGKHGIDTTFTNNKGKVKPKRVEGMNAELRQKRAYGSNEQKQVTAWYGIRTSAAHAKYSEYNVEQVRNMIHALRSFISQYPA